MDKGQVARANRITIEGLAEIDKAVDVLTDYAVDVFIYNLISERAFMGLNTYGEIQNKSDFLKGAFVAFKELSNIVGMFKQVNSDKK